MKLMLLAIWHYRHFILTSIRNDFRTRFARSKLGTTWTLLQPLALAAIYALVLGRVLAVQLPDTHKKYAYVIYLLGGLLGWNLFTELITRCLTIFVDNASLLKKMVFPRICLPLIVSGSCVVNNIVLLIATIIIFLLIGNYPGWLWLYLFMLMGITWLFGLALGVILGVLNVFVRDVAQVMNVVLQLWFWMTPIVYAIHTLPPAFAPILRFNPMFAIVSSYQQVLLWDNPPHFKTLGAIVVLSLILLALGMSLFRRAAPDMVDVL